MEDPVFEALCLMVLAGWIGYRFTRAITVDDIGEPLRRRGERLKDADTGSVWRRAVHKLLHCPHCLGFWLTGAITIIVSAMMLDVDWTTDIIVALAATGMQSWLASLAAGAEQTVEIAETAKTIEDEVIG